MDFEVGSLANLISGNKLVSSSKKKKLFDSRSSEKEIVKFKSVQKIKKPKLIVEELENASYDDAEPSEEKKKVKKKHKIKPVNYADFNKDEENENDMENKPSNAFCAEKRLKYKRKKENEAKNEDRKECEIFVGNVPINITKNKLKKLFGKYGTIESVRLRCAPLSDPRIPKKVAMIKKKFHPDRNSMHAFVRYTDGFSAERAVDANGILFEDHHLRVDLVAGESRHDTNKAVFLGNVPFAAEEDDLWKVFEPCGPISGIRIVRDRFTGVGKGFAYINFKSTDAVELALKLNGTELNKRQLRVERCVKKAAGKKKEKTKKVKKQKPSNSDEKSKKRKQEDSNEPEMSDDDQNINISKKIKLHKADKKLHKSKMNVENDDGEADISNRVDSQKANKNISFKMPFQGQRTAEEKKLKKKKKGKVNKGELKKTSLISKISSDFKPAMKKVKKPTFKLRSIAKKVKLKPGRK